MNRIEKIWFIKALLFTVIFFSVSYFNRLAEDDFLFLETVKQKGIWQATLAHYYSWNTRWIAIAWLNVWYWFINKGVPVFIFNWLTLFFMISCFYVLLKRINIKLSKNQKFLYSILFCIYFFFSTFNIPDAWYWINSTTMYLWNIGFLCLATSIVLKREKLTTLDYFMLCFCGIYIGGASEPLVITVIFITSLILVFNNKLKAFQISKNALVLFSFSILLSFLIAFNGAGHVARSNALPHTSFITSSHKSFYYSLKILAWHFPKHIIPFILFSMPFFYLGYINADEKKEFKIWSLYAKGFIAIFILSYINTLPVVYLMGDYGPSRAWTSIAFFICIITGFLFYRTGEFIKSKYLNEKLFELTGIISFCFLLGSGIYNLQIANNYAKDYDAKKQFNDLPESGWLHSAKAGSTPSN